VISIIFHNWGEFRRIPWKFFPNKILYNPIISYWGKKLLKLNISAYCWKDYEKGDITNYRACINEDGEELIFVNERDITQVKNMLAKYVKHEIEKIEKSMIRLKNLKNSLELIQDDNIDWNYISEHKKERYVYPSKRRIPPEDW
jgi:hypothetical protein